MEGGVHQRLKARQIFVKDTAPAVEDSGMRVFVCDGGGEERLAALRDGADGREDVRRREIM